MPSIKFNEVVDNNLVVNECMTLHKRGTYTYEEALEEAIIQLAEQNKGLFAKLMSANQGNTIWRP
jgi:hypothetical protein